MCSELNLILKIYVSHLPVKSGDTFAVEGIADPLFTLS